jgi:hypothetical protein
MDALQLFSGAVYGRAGEADSMALNNAVDQALAAVRSLWTRSLKSVQRGAPQRCPVNAAQPSRIGGHEEMQNGECRMQASTAEFCLLNSELP